MYIKVKMLNGFNKEFTYSVPANLISNVSIGSIVSVPVKQSVQLAAVTAKFNDVLNAEFKIRSLIRIEEFPADNFYIDFLQKVSNYYCLDINLLLRRTKNFFSKAECLEPSFELINDNYIPSLEPSFESKETATKGFSAQFYHESINLTEEQLNAYNSISQHLFKDKFFPALLHGVTGSGKSEIYKKLIEDCVKNNKSAIFLLPEVSLAMQFELKFKEFFKNSFKIYSFHSATTIKEKRELWLSLLNKEPILIIGVHLPVLLPISNLGAIIVDEEHEGGYQEKKHPKLNSKEISLMRAAHYKIPIVLGSATPCSTSFYNASTGAWAYYRLKKRYAGEFPKIKVVNLLKSKYRDKFWISDELVKAIKLRLEKREQTIIFINRRGHSLFVQCKECGFIFECSNCSVSLTLHEDESLQCHYCGLKSTMPPCCSRCNSSADKFLKKGIGTQQAVSLLKSIFPASIIERADMDTGKNRKKFKELLKNFEAGKVDILVGTQTITKGFHFPNVTLVGVLWADINLNFPIYNASEVALQQLIQVAGRAGRQQKSSDVIVQVLTQNRINDFFSELDYSDFIKQELSFRKDFNYPPYCRFAEIEFKNDSEEYLEKDCIIALPILEKLCKDQIALFGPSQPALYKLKGSFRKTFYLKGRGAQELSFVYLQLKNYKFSSQIFFTPSPQN